MASIAVGMHLQKNQEDINNLIEQGKRSSLKSLDKMYQASRDKYNDAIRLYDPYAQTGQAAFNQYADASGVNGQAGYDRAEGNFRASPGYQWQVDQATDQAARKMSSIGALGSGNTITAIQDRANHLADQEYDDYLGRLDNIGKTGFAATGAQAGLKKGVGDLYQQQGRDRVGVIQNSTGMGVNSRMQTGMAQADALQGGMMAGQNAAANRWNFGMQGLNLLSSLAGKAFGGGFGG